jgi:carboxypeptidase Taq
MNKQQLYIEYQQHLKKIADVKYASAVLQWDQETYMPVNGAGFRAQQIATLSEITHELFTQTRFKHILQELQSADGLSAEQQKNIALTWYDYTQQEKLSAVFVRQLSEAISRSFQSWIAARKENKFSVFEKDLAQVITLKKQEADLLGYEKHPYNALLNQYERGCTTTLLDKIFSDLQEPLKNLLSKIKNRPQVDDAFLHQHFPKQQQWNFGMKVLEELGFDMNSGRQDISEHPFTTNFSSKDVRVTTRIDENDFSNMTWSCIHECGHALYEQGLSENEYGLPLGEYTSLSIHESQSRLWENNVGRSIDCWNHFYPALSTYFPDQFKKVPLEAFYKGINKVTPSLIRTEADELTYHFHVLIRYQLEKDLIEGSLSVNDIPAYWNEQYEKLLGVKVPDDKWGCLQDVHWSHGSFGYFATYSLGSFYAAQFFNTAKKHIPDLPEEIRNGRFQPLLNWLRTNIHIHGRRYTSEELCKNITNEPLTISYFLEYVLDKYKIIYDF